MNNKKGMKELVRSEIKDSLNNVITRETNGKGGIYRDKNGKIIETYIDELSFIVAVNFEPLEMFLRKVQEEAEAEEERVIAQVLFNSAKKKIEEAINYIEENYGMVVSSGRLSGR